MDFENKIAKLQDFIEIKKVVKFIQFTVLCLFQLKDVQIFRRIHKTTIQGCNKFWGENALQYIRRLYRLMSAGEPWKNETVCVTTEVIEDSVIFWMWSLIIIIEEQIDMIARNNCNTTQLKQEYADIVDDAFALTQTDAAAKSVRKKLLQILHWKSTNHILYLKPILKRMKFNSIDCLVSQKSLKFLGDLQ